MFEIAPIEERLGGRRTFSNYEKCSGYEKQKLKAGFKRIKEYKDFYLYGKYDFAGNLLYRECFSKFDVDGVKNVKRSYHGPIFKW